MRDWGWVKDSFVARTDVAAVWMTEWDLVLVTCRCLGWPCRRCRCCNGLMCNGCNRPPCQCCCPPAAPAPRRSQRIANRRGACWRCCCVTAGAATCSVCHWLNWHRATTLHNPTACDTVHLGYTAQATTTFIYFFWGGGRSGGPFRLHTTFWRFDRHYLEIPR